MATELPKAYEPKAAQGKWLKFWAAKEYFHADPAKSGEPYTIVIPPPNVTGALHMGHALNNTLQDVLIRWRRMQGRNTLWMPGTDHAGIATQAVVERLIFNTEKKTRHDLGREALVAKIWEWKDKYEKRILGQLQEMGASCDWQRTRFTLDETCAKAVRETFFRMFRDGYIYRGKRLVNWDAQLQTSVADDETYTEDTKGGFWTFKYAVVGQPDTFIRFSTTRPETMLGDTALCVHPSDERYKALVGKMVLQPLVNREIPIIADALLADPTLGTGCVKVTPAHDPNDYACWTRNPQIGIINILNPDGTINANGGPYSGQPRAKVREAVVQAMEELGLFEGKEDRVIPLKYSDRSKTPIEPYLSDQWFVKMTDRDDGKPGLAQTAMDAVTDGRVQFFPKRYENSYLDWLGEKRDWCVSRQLWWGHRIPVWRLGPVQMNEDESNGIEGQLDQIANASPERICWRIETTEPDEGNISTVTFLVCTGADAASLEAELAKLGFAQDPDVLDTWFSSALWPHSTLGWPEATPDLKRYYPTSTLVTSRDIITLWVARMVMTGLYNTGEVPFRHVVIHPKIMDGFGEGMSKSKGNGVDPLDIIDLYGADAMRFGVVSLATETQDSRMPVSNVCPHCGTLIPQKREHQSGKTRQIVCPGDKAAGVVCGKPFRPSGPWLEEDPELPTAKGASERFETGRNFANKLWNATRFILMNLEGYSAAPLDPNALPTEDRWILSRLATTAKAVTEALEGYRFSEVARLVYDFAWNEFCDWYIEMSKGRRTDPVCQRVLVGVLDGIVRLIHPVMPFLAESLWHALNEAAPIRGLLKAEPAGESVAVAPWPGDLDSLIDDTTEGSIARMQELVRGVREIRNRYMLDKAPLDLSVKCSDATVADLNALAPFIKLLGGITNFTCGPTAAKPKQAGSILHAQFEGYVNLAGLIDVPAELKRLEKQIADKKKMLDSIQGKLNNAGFLAKAAPEQVQETRDKAAELESQIRTMAANEAELKAV
ncbi:valine--tRNA ligase [Limnoglobus roseus]|uniref:Valine--tRNA ligase n=1 Tax=Limnoglobus roseus TaxID=2598579 RepID=A0A5C1AJE6_9BACT|nr:valine--tRNA ligase [Limnoglobus roseus]QEL18126.1 valine--tRNA ligase [Limnoglobus roseus]